MQTEAYGAAYSAFSQEDYARAAARFSDLLRNPNQLSLAECQAAEYFYADALLRSGKFEESFRAFVPVWKTPQHLKSDQAAMALVALSREPSIGVRVLPFVDRRFDTDLSPGTCSTPLHCYGTLVAAMAAITRDDLHRASELLRKIPENSSVAPLARECWERLGVSSG